MNLPLGFQRRHELVELAHGVLVVLGLGSVDLPVPASELQEAQPPHNKVRGQEVIPEVPKITLPTDLVRSAITDDRSPVLHEPVENVLPDLGNPR